MSMTVNGTAVTQNGKISGPFAHFTWIEFRAVDFCCFYGKAPASRDTPTGHIALCGSEPLIRIICCRQGKLSIGTGQQNAATTIHLPANSHNLCFIPADIQIVTEYDFTLPQELLIVDLKLNAFRQYFPLDHHAFTPLNERINQSELSALSSASLPLGPEMISLIQAIAHCKRPQFSKPSYIKAKIIELMLLQAEQQWKSTYQRMPTLRDDELQRIYEVRDILHAEPANDHTLLSLAHRVGTNDATLKKQFKQVFGTTVFHYLTDVRMRLAKEILLEQNEKIATVAQRVGYKHATHFTAAFKKHFGYLPTQVRA
ncbi:helix-turn-helix transcriptional regulator [Parapedobacter deserti]|uniref:Helix-turn-helix transcriptional regulator n=1 Tax=Parapedobacter deserti TaxID=1912957 RepID=A0ABV7JI94_9SPHI